MTELNQEVMPKNTEVVMTQREDTSVAFFLFGLVIGGFVFYLFCVTLISIIDIHNHPRKLPVLGKYVRALVINGVSRCSRFTRFAGVVANADNSFRAISQASGVDISLLDVRKAGELYVTYAKQNLKNIKASTTELIHQIKEIELEDQIKKQENSKRAESFLSTLKNID